MRENYRKALFITVLLIILAVMVFFTAVEDVQKPTNTTNSDVLYIEITNKKNYLSMNTSLPHFQKITLYPLFLYKKPLILYKKDRNRTK